MSLKLHMTLPILLLCAVSACQKALPNGSPIGVGNSVAFNVQGKDIVVTRTRDAVEIFPRATSASDQISVNVVGPRGQGGSAVSVSGTAFGERALAELAMISACAPGAPNVGAGLAQIVNYDRTIARYDSASGDAIFAVGGCPGLDGGS